MRVLLPVAATLFLCLGASAQSYSNEPDTYRHGGTYATQQASSDQSCAEICRADTNCLAWSFLKPGTGIGASKCELKQTIGQTEVNPLMISGVSPRFSRQDQAAPRPVASSSLLGGHTTQSHQTAPRPLRSRAAATSTTQGAHSALPSVSSGRVLSPTDPRIVRSTNRTVTPAPVQRAAPAAQPASTETRAQRPYDNLRNRTFPNYSVQDGATFESDTAVKEPTTTATSTTGAGS